MNTLTQQMETIFNSLIANTNQTYEVLENQIGRIAYFFRTPSVKVWPSPQISNAIVVEIPEKGITHATLGQNQGLQQEAPLNGEEVEQIK